MLDGVWKTHTLESRLGLAKSVLNREVSLFLILQWDEKKCPE